MRIIVDAMGGDRAPAVEVAGAVEVVRNGNEDVDVVLVGDEARIRSELERFACAEHPRLTVEHAPERIDMSEDAARQVRRKKGASIAVAARLLKSGGGDGLVSAGNTGAVVASSLFLLGRLKGVRRPAIATFVPTDAGGAIILDVGANSDCTPQDLLQFALMGETYARRLLGREEPKIGLLNIGEESTKGNKLVLAAHNLFGERRWNFVGNVEGRDVFKGDVDVVVCDGFVGNIVLKFSESVLHLMSTLARQMIGGSLRHRLGAFLLRPAFRRIAERLNYEEYGGAPLLGVDGAVIIAHGGSSPKAIKNAILVAARFARARINDHIRQKLQGQGFGEVSG
jgi:glycerol-3-phosphate acyltransferase PlsX